MIPSHLVVNSDLAASNRNSCKMLDDVLQVDRKSGKDAWRTLSFNFKEIIDKSTKKTAGKSALKRKSLALSKFEFSAPDAQGVNLGGDFNN